VGKQRGKIPPVSDEIIIGDGKNIIIHKGVLQ
jgi:hypothetical protein